MNKSLFPKASSPPSKPDPKDSMYRLVTGVRYESAVAEFARETSLIYGERSVLGVIIRHGLVG